MKKHPKADLESKRSVFFQIGLLVSLALCLVAFEWTDYSMAHEWNVPELEAELLTAEIIKPIRFEKPEETVTNKEKKTIIDEFVVKKDPGVGDDEKIDDDFVIDFFGSDEFGDCLDCDEPDEDDLDIVHNVNSIQIKPYYKDCENILDYEDQANCSYQKIRSFINKEAKYPSLAQELGYQGRVWVSFVVDRKGEIKDVKVEQGAFKMLNAEAVKAVERLPQMIPAKQLGKPVSVRFRIPVDFKFRS